MRVLHRASIVSVLAVLAGLIAVPAVQAATDAVRITSPTTGSTVSGQSVPVAVTSSAAGGVAVLTLYLDGSYSGDYYCTGATTCSTTFVLDLSGSSGQHSLQVQMESNSGATLNSSVVSVGINSPKPAAIITSPSSGTAVTGTFQVKATGTVDASQSDTAYSMDLFVDDVYADTTYCNGVNDHACPVTFSVDTTGFIGTHFLQVRLTTANGLVATSPTITVKAGSAAPTAAITSPTASSSVSGIIDVTATGSVAASQSDSAYYVDLFLDGAYADTTYCNGPDPRSCTVRFPVDTTGLTGSHSLQVRLTTANGVTAISPTTSISVVSPEPTTTITSPAPGSTVASSVVVNANASTAPGQTDSPYYVDLFVDGSYEQTVYCSSADERSCEVAFGLDVSQMSGAHTLQTRVTTAAGRTASSPRVPFSAYSATRTTLAGLAVVRPGTTEVARGHVTALNDGAPARGMAVQVTYTRAVGGSSTVTTTTNSNGDFAVAFRPTSNTTVTARAVARTPYGASSSATVARVSVPFSCKLAAGSVRRGVTGKGACSMPGLPSGTGGVLQVYAGGAWHAVASGRSSAGAVTFSYRFGRPGTYYLRVLMAGSRPYVATVGPTLRLAVT